VLAAVGHLLVLEPLVWLDLLLLQLRLLVLLLLLEPVLLGAWCI
jgi:hypothetical protein